MTPTIFAKTGTLTEPYDRAQQGGGAALLIKDPTVFYIIFRLGNNALHQVNEGDSTTPC